jgi:large subunit ribosomal protein L10
MAITKAKKTTIKDNLENKIKDAESMVFVNFHGLKVSETNALRKSFRSKGLGYTVAKKTLIRLALQNSKIEGTLPTLDGEIAMVYGSDAVLPAKELAVFEKQFKDKVKAVGGVLEGKYMDAAQVKVLSKIPGREVLYGKLVNVMYAPVSGFVRTLNGVPGSFVRVLNNIKDTKTV